MSDFINCPACKGKISTTNFGDEGMHDFKTWDEECPECEAVFEVVATLEVNYQVNMEAK